MLRGLAWAARRDQVFALEEDPQQRRLADWRDQRTRRHAELAEKTARREAEFTALIPGIAAQVAAEVSAAVLAALQTVRVGHHEVLNHAPTTMSAPTTSMVDDHDLNQAPATTAATSTVTDPFASSPPIPVAVAYSYTTGRAPHADIQLTCNVDVQPEAFTSAIGAPSSSTAHEVELTKVAATSATVYAELDSDLTTATPTTCSTKYLSRDVTVLGPALATATTSAVGAVPERCCFDPEPVVATYALESSGARLTLVNSLAHGANSTCSSATTSVLSVVPMDSALWAVQTTSLTSERVMSIQTAAAVGSISAALGVVSICNDSEIALAAPITCSTECPGGDKGTTRASAAPAATMTSSPSACLVSVGGILLAAPDLQVWNMLGCSLPLHFGFDTPQDARNLPSTVEIQLTVNNDFALTLGPVVAQKHGMLEKFRTLSSTSLSLVFEEIFIDFDEKGKHLVILDDIEPDLSSELPNGVVLWPVYHSATRTILLQPWDPGLLLSSMDDKLSTIAHGLVVRLPTTSEVHYLQGSFIHRQLRCRLVIDTILKWVVALVQLQPRPSWGLSVLILPLASRATYASWKWIFHHIRRGNSHHSQLIEWSLQSEFGFCTLGNILFCYCVLVQWEIPWAVILASREFWLQYCSAGREYLYGYVNFWWIIAWSVSYHYSLSGLETLSACVFYLVRQNCPTPTICTELWFRFLIGFRIASYNMFSRSNCDCFPTESFAIEHWLMLRNSSNVLANVLCPTRPHSHIPVSRSDDDSFSYVLVLGQECLTLQTTRNALHLQEATSIFLQASTDSRFIEYSSLIGCELLNWKITWLLYLWCYTSSNKYGMANTVPFQFIAYISMWSFRGLQFCQGKLSWDPGIWALLCLFRFFTPTEAIGVRHATALAYYCGHFLDHANTSTKSMLTKTTTSTSSVTKRTPATTTTTTSSSSKSVPSATSTSARFASTTTATMPSAKS